MKNNAMFIPAQRCGTYKDDPEENKGVHLITIDITINVMLLNLMKRVSLRSSGLGRLGPSCWSDFLNKLKKIKCYTIPDFQTFKKIIIIKKTCNQSFKHYLCRILLFKDA